MTRTTADNVITVALTALGCVIGGAVGYYFSTVWLDPNPLWPSRTLLSVMYFSFPLGAFFGAFHSVFLCEDEAKPTKAVVGEN